MTKIKIDKRNYRIHPEENKELIKSSLENYGAGRSIVVDSEDSIIAGNGVFEQAESLDMPVRVIETKGDELIVVKRTDLKTEDRKRKLLAIADNKTSDTSEFNFSLLEEDLNEDEIIELGFELDDFLEEPEPEENFARDIVSMNYEPKNEKPKLSELVDTEKYEKLIENIQASELPEDEKKFLRMAASRHIVFDYSNIADYYAHSDKNTQGVMEDSALIIIDFDKAIEDGYVVLTERIKEVFKNDIDEE